MPYVMEMKWDGVTPEQYDETRDIVQWETDGPKGGIFHVAWFEDGALRVVDVWDSPDAFQAFADTRLTPGTTKVGIAGEPQVSFAPAHRVFDAAAGTVRT
jgi:hypothetical protein